MNQDQNYGAWTLEKRGAEKIQCKGYSEVEVHVDQGSAI